MGFPQQSLSQAITFTDVTASAGVDDAGFTVGSAWGDYDGDGLLDLIITNLESELRTTGQGNLRLYHNLGGGVFSEVTQAAGIGGTALWHHPAWGDYDNDGDLDLSITNEGGPNRLYRNNGNGTFTDVAVSVSVANAGDGHAGIWGDYDDDGDLDLFVVNGNTTDRLYCNNDDGTFTDVRAAAGLTIDATLGAAWADYDGDGNLDLSLAGPFTLYHNNGNGTFTDVTFLAGLNGISLALGIAWGDYDNDGDLDVYISPAGPGRLYRNNGNGSFSNVTTISGTAATSTRSATWGDVDNDGWFNLYVSNNKQQIQLYWNNRDGTFTDQRSAMALDGIGNLYGVAFGDYDQDGDLDLYMTVASGANRLYRNDGNAHRWLTVRLQGVQSNPDGIGARVTTVAGTLKQRRDVDIGSGFLSQGSLPVEFGFGYVATIDSLIIDWPSGIRQVLTQVATNQRLSLVETAPIPNYLHRCRRQHGCCGRRNGQRRSLGRL